MVVVVVVWGFRLGRMVVSSRPTERCCSPCGAYLWRREAALHAPLRGFVWRGHLHRWTWWYLVCCRRGCIIVIGCEVYDKGWIKEAIPAVCVVLRTTPAHCRALGLMFSLNGWSQDLHEVHRYCDLFWTRTGSSEMAYFRVCLSDTFTINFPVRLFSEELQIFQWICRGIRTWLPMSWFLYNIENTTTNKQTKKDWTRISSVWRIYLQYMDNHDW